jgi:hypothetical protein
MDAREVEMRWMVKGMHEKTRFIVMVPFLLFLFAARLNSVLFYILWTCAPILVSIISFTTYVMLGNQLTISTAFTVCHFKDFFYDVYSIVSFYRLFLCLRWSELR